MVYLMRAILKSFGHTCPGRQTTSGTLPQSQCHTQQNSQDDNYTQSRNINTTTHKNKTALE